MSFLCRDFCFLFLFQPLMFQTRWILLKISKASQNCKVWYQLLRHFNAFLMTFISFIFIQWMLTRTICHIIACSRVNVVRDACLCFWVTKELDDITRAFICYWRKKYDNNFIYLEINLISYVHFGHLISLILWMTILWFW